MIRTTQPKIIRLDQLLVERGLAENRTRAQALIMAGLVFSGGKRLDKPGLSIAGDIPLQLKGRDHPWVSRGGVKLAHGLEHFSIVPKDLVCLDVGASTGGFTDVLLGQGAARVYAVDVGRGHPGRTRSTISPALRTTSGGGSNSAGVTPVIRPNSRPRSRKRS